MLKRVETPEALSPIVQGLRSQGKIVVLAIGNFEVLKASDIRFLEDAQSRGDYLIIGAGPKWPGSKANRTTITRNHPKDRAFVLAALRCVNYVCIFEQPTAESLIRTLKPSTVAYSGEWTERSIPEKDVIQELKIPLLFCGESKSSGSSKKLAHSRKGS